VYYENNDEMFCHFQHVADGIAYGGSKRFEAFCRRSEEVRELSEAVICL
jgi:hypothetical protein